MHVILISYYEYSCKLIIYSKIYLNYNSIDLSYSNLF